MISNIDAIKEYHDAAQLAANLSRSVSIDQAVKRLNAQFFQPLFAKGKTIFMSTVKRTVDERTGENQYQRQDRPLATFK